MKTLKRSLLAAAALVTMGTQANAATGNTAVSFNFPDIVILHYVSGVQFNVPASVFGIDAINEGTSTPTLTFTNPTLSGDAGMGVTVTGGPNIANLQGSISNAWAVRGITTSGNIQVQIQVTTATATNGTSTVTISNPLVSAPGVTAAATITVPAPGFSAANAVIGNVAMGLDFSAVTAVGLHTGAQYSITATAAP